MHPLCIHYESYPSRAWQRPSPAGNGRQRPPGNAERVAPNRLVLFRMISRQQNSTTNLIPTSGIDFECIHTDSTISRRGQGYKRFIRVTPTPQIEADGHVYLATAFMLHQGSDIASGHWMTLFAENARWRLAADTVVTSFPDFPSAMHAISRLPRTVIVNACGRVARVQRQALALAAEERTVLMTQ